MGSAESKAKSIMSRELGYEYTTPYQLLRQLDYTGYTHSYLYKTANYSKLTTTAKLNVVVELAECDKPGLKFCKKTFSQLKHKSLRWVY